MRVLVVEDERKLAQVLASSLQAEHYDVVVARTGEDGYAAQRDAIKKHVERLINELQKR